MWFAAGPVMGWFDQRKLERALYNLLLNACEAAPAAGRKCGSDRRRQSPGSISISVADNGPGIADSIRDRLFHPFVSFGKENGTGLGLAVVQKIVQDHGGEISVERTVEGTTVFRHRAARTRAEKSIPGPTMRGRCEASCSCPGGQVQPEFDFASGPLDTSFFANIACLDPDAQEDVVKTSRRLPHAAPLWRQPLSSYSAGLAGPRSSQHALGPC